MNLGVDVRCLQDNVRTGVGEYTWQILNNLAQDKSINLSGFANAAHKIDLPPSLSQIMKIHKGNVPNKLMNFLQWRRLGKPLDNILNSSVSKQEAIWLPNPSFINLSGKVPTILTIHDLSFIHFPKFFPYKGRLWYFPAVKKLIKNGLRGNFLIAAVSKHTAEDLLDLYPELENKVRIVPPGLDERYFTSVTAEISEHVRHKYNLPNKFFFSLGTIEPRKNYGLLLSAYEQLFLMNPDLEYDLVIAGNWGWKYEPIKRQLSKMTSRHRIKFINYVDNDDKPAIYQSASLFLFPSLYEGIGLPVLEAMASQIPVICSNSSSLPEIVGNAGTLVSPQLLEAWVNRLADYVHKPATYLNLVTQGVMQAQNFSWQKTAAAYKRNFIELINKK